MKWEKILIALVSAAFAVILYVLLPIESSKYRLSMEDQEVFTKVISMRYADMDGDARAELIRCKEATPVPAIVVQRGDYQVIDQWNLNGDWIAEAELFFSDFDHDNFKEMVSFTYYKDSIWIHVIEPMQAGGTEIHQALDHARLFNGNHDWHVYFGSPHDMNMDGKDDYTIAIRSGFTIQPRKVYFFSPIDKKSTTSDLAFGNNIHTPVLLDLDGDGNMEITGSMSAPRNLRDHHLLLDDSCAWFVIYDHHLDMKTEPKPYYGKPSYFKVLPLKKDGRQILLTYNFARQQDSVINLFEVWEWGDDGMHLLRSRKLLYESEINLLGADQLGNGSFYVAMGEDILLFNMLLLEEKRIKFDQLKTWFTYISLDVDADNVGEQIMFRDESQLTICRNDFSHPVSIDLGFHIMEPQISVFNDGRNKFICVSRKHHFQILKYSRNPLYPFRFLILFASFLLYYAIFTILLGFQKKRIEARQASERQVLHYQLTNVVQQLDPHFLFNALSNISSYYHKGDKEHAQSYLAKVSRLVRSTLENSERMSISLSEELAFVRDYLSVEQIRMGDNLNFGIDVEKSLIEQIQIPKMLIQNFVENAVKHGIRHLKDRAGVIRIYSERAGSLFHVIIEDNGIGRESATEIGSAGTGNGLRMVQKSLGIFEKLERVRIEFRIEDLQDEAGEAMGTRVLLKIPLPGS